MALLEKLQSSGQKQWCKRSPNTCCSKKILLLQVWQVFFTFSWIILIETKVVSLNFTFISISNYFSLFLAPFIGWLADVKFGRYAVVKFGLLLSFLAGVFYFLALVHYVIMVYHILGSIFTSQCTALCCKIINQFLASVFYIFALLAVGDGFLQ